MTNLNQWMGRVVSSLAVLASVSGAAQAAEPKKTITISVIQAMTSQEWNSDIRAGAEAAAAQFGGAVKVRFAGPPNIDPPKQVQLFQNAVQAGTDAAVIVNVAQAFFVEPVKQAQAKGVAVVWTNDPPSAEVPGATFVGMDSFRMGQVVGDLLADGLLKRTKLAPEQVHGDGLTGMCVRGIAVLEQRVAGLKARLKERLPNVNLLPTIETKLDRRQNFTAWDQAIRANPKALFYADPCELGGINIAKIVKEGGMSVPTVSWDTPEEVRTAIKRGEIIGAVPPKFFYNTYAAVTLVAKYLLSGQPMPTGWFQTQMTTVDSGNVDALIKAYASPDGQMKLYQSDLGVLLKDLPRTLRSLKELEH